MLELLSFSAIEKGLTATESSMEVASPVEHKQTLVLSYMGIPRVWSEFKEVRLLARDCYKYWRAVLYGCREVDKEETKSWSRGGRILSLLPLLG